MGKSANWWVREADGKWINVYGERMNLLSRFKHFNSSINFEFHRDLS